MTIDNLISWLQEAEDNNTWLVSTQSVKRHLEKIKETEQLTIPDSEQQRELLEAYTQFLWTQHNNLTDADNNKLALEKFIASYNSVMHCSMCDSTNLEDCGGGEYSCEDCGHFPITA
jgi:hypothetical protein